MTIRLDSRAIRKKRMGIHYTPPDLARFLAQRIMAQVALPMPDPVRVLDPACGDGVLLEALLQEFPSGVNSRLELWGVEADEDALHGAHKRLGHLGGKVLHLIRADFLAQTEDAQRRLWNESRAGNTILPESFDIVIANPPYVRTQALGGECAQGLAARFSLSGRVDLCHAFVVAMIRRLRPGALAGFLTSNRFMTTIAGTALRRYLADNCEIEEVIDLGDTKLFEAAVLPAIFVGSRKRDGSQAVPRKHARFLKVYSCPEPKGRNLPPAKSSESLFGILRRGEPGCYRCHEGFFELTVGEFAVGSDASRVWALTTAQQRVWLRRVCSRFNSTIGEIAYVRVGIKTTADGVFVRQDWDALPEEVRPEPEILRPLLTSEDIRRWIVPRGYRPKARILYPHEVHDGKRRAVELGQYPKAKAYLQLHEGRLRARQYVAASKRRWYEIWVPQDPGGWAIPKILFPDISQGPRFCLDLDGNLVAGNCYWITLRPGIPYEAIYLILAVANSAPLLRYHELAFNNKLYAGRYRYLTQYVSAYPCPHPSSSDAKELISAVLTSIHPDAGTADSDIDDRIDLMVSTMLGSY